MEKSVNLSKSVIIFPDKTTMKRYIKYFGEQLVDELKNRRLGIVVNKRLLRYISNSYQK